MAGADSGRCRAWDQTSFLTIPGVSACRTTENMDLDEFSPDTTDVVSSQGNWEHLTLSFPRVSGYKKRPSVYNVLHLIHPFTDNLTVISSPEQHQHVDLSERVRRSGL